MAEVEIIPEEHISERTQIVDIPVPQMLEELQECILVRDEQIVDVPVPLAQPGDQARRESADPVHQQGYRRIYCDTATGPSDSNFCEDSGSPKDAVHRQFCGRPCDLAATGPSASNCCEDSGSPDAVLRQSSGRAGDHAVAATASPSDSRCVEDRESLDSAAHRQSCESTCDHADASVLSPRERTSLEAERDRLRKLIEHMSGHGFGGAVHLGTDA